MIRGRQYGLAAELRETLDYAGKKKRKKRDVFLAEMAAAVPWSALEAVIAPHYPKQGPQGSRRPFPIAVMLRIYCLQQWYNLSDPVAEEALYDIQSMRAFCNLELGRDPIPDETTILNFRHLLEAHGLTKTVFEAVAEYLEARGALLRGGTIVDATLIAASASTKNEAGKRDPQMHSSKKGNQWYFGMKAHIGVDAISGLVHTAGVTSGNVHDAKLMDRLIRDDDTAVYGDIAALLCQHSPGDPCQLVGEGHSQNIRMQALSGTNKPGSKAVLRPVRRPYQNDPGCLNEEHAQVGVAALGDVSEDRSISGRHLFRHEAEPSRIIDVGIAITLLNLPSRWWGVICASACPAL